MGMKPLNATRESCNPISSNCVVWQGITFDCFDLCQGDTVTDVMNKMGETLCTLSSTFDVINYVDELGQFSLGLNQPTTFEQIIKLMLTRIDWLEQCTGCIPDCTGPHDPIENTTTDTCCDTVIPLPECLQYTDEFGGKIIELSLINYIKRLANEFCPVEQAIPIIYSTLSAHQISITALENAPVPTFVLPQIIPSCVLTPVLTDIDVVLIALEAQFCALRGATGDTVNIYTNIAKEPAGLSQDDKLCGEGNMGSITGWNDPVTTMGDAIGNMWLTIEDMRCAIRNIQINCCPSGCDAIKVDLYASINGNNLSIFLSGTIPVGFLECNPAGTVFTITDSFGNSTTTTLPMVTQMNGGAYIVDLSGTPINVTADLTITANPCLHNSNTNTQCESYISYVLVNTATCPTPSFIPTQTTIAYSFVSSIGLKTYSIELWTNDFSTMLTNHILVVNGVQTSTGTFTGLTANTNYKIRFTVTMSGSGITTQCPFTTVTTIPLTCPSPTAVEATITEGPLA